MGSEQMNLGNVIIFGDSYSTFKGWLPAGYGYSYSEEGTDGNEVVDVKDTWWYQVISQTGSNLVMNNSWSGTTIGYTGYNGEDMSETKSFIARFEKLANEGFFERNKIDTVFIFGGTNDSWSGAPLGKLRFENLDSGYCFDVLPAICYLFKTVKETLPDAKVYCLVNTKLNEEITEGMKEAAEHYSVSAIEFDQIDKVNGHPTMLGMKQISDGVLEYINK